MSQQILERRKANVGYMTITVFGVCFFFRNQATILGLQKKTKQKPDNTREHLNKHCHPMVVQIFAAQIC